MDIASLNHPIKIIRPCNSNYEYLIFNLCFISTFFQFSTYLFYRIDVFSKTIIGDSATGVFNGKIYVEKEAQKTNAFQQNNNILVSEKATINAKPQLEIFADDVKCSHGCTIGQLDESAMFYMQQRGIPKKEARALLMFAFCNEAIESIKIPELKQRITKIIASKLEVKLGFDL